MGTPRMMRMRRMIFRHGHTVSSWYRSVHRKFGGCTCNNLQAIAIPLSWPIFKRRILSTKYSDSCVSICVCMDLSKYSDYIESWKKQLPSGFSKPEEGPQEWIFWKTTISILDCRRKYLALFYIRFSLALGRLTAERAGGGDCRTEGYGCNALTCWEKYKLIQTTSKIYFWKFR